METMLIWGLALLGTALFIALIEVFIPTGGLLAAGSVVAAIAGVICLFRVSASWGLAGSGALIVGIPTLFFLGLRVLPHTPVGRRIILESDSDEPAPPPRNPLDALLGAEGLVLTDLRPVGTVRVNNQRYDAISETRLIRAGDKVRISAVEGTTLKVRPITDTPPSRSID